MNKTILFVALVFMGVWITASAFYFVMALIYGSNIKVLDFLYQFVPLVIMITGFIIVLKRYKKTNPSDGDSYLFNKNEILSVLGVLSLVIGLYMLSSNISFALQVVRMNNEIDLLTFEKIFPPCILIGFGVYYGYVRKLKSA